MKTYLSLSVLGTLLATGLGAQGAIVTFTFDESANLQSTLSQTVSGLTFSASNPNSSNGKFAADSDGLLVTDNPGSGPSSFQFSFSAPVQMVSYSIGFVLDGTSGSFTLSRPGQSSTGNGLASGGSFSINGTFTPSANQTINLTSSLSGSPGWSQIKTFTVNTVPEPAEGMALAGIACGIGAWLLRARRR